MTILAEYMTEEELASDLQGEDRQGQQAHAAPLARPGLGSGVGPRRRHRDLPDRRRA
jgi:hypothetical protein